MHWENEYYYVQRSLRPLLHRPYDSTKTKKFPCRIISSLDDLFTRRENAHLGKIVNYHIHIIIYLVLENSPIKSNQVLSYSLVGTSKRWYKPFFLLFDLLMQKSMHPLINWATFSYLQGQYTYFYNLKIIFPTPKFPITLEMWASMINYKPFIFRNREFM